MRAGSLNGPRQVSMSFWLTPSGRNTPTVGMRFIPTGTTAMPCYQSSPLPITTISTSPWAHRSAEGYCIVFYDRLIWNLIYTQYVCTWDCGNGSEYLSWNLCAG